MNSSPDQERQLFARLSVFSGGFDLEAATAVCAGGAIVSGQILDEIEGLVDKSLLAVERRAGATRFRMLDFVRQYAAERLAAAGEGVPLADRHRAYFRELAQRADRELWALVPAGRARLDDESPNLRAAIDDGCARAPDDALAMVGALGLYWRVRGRLAEGVTATEQSLGAAPPEPSPGRALALAKLSLLSFWLGDFARTQSSATSALEMGAAIGDTRSQALALGQLGALVILSDPGAGDPMLMRAAELARTAGDQVALCDALASLATCRRSPNRSPSPRAPERSLVQRMEALQRANDIRTRRAQLKRDLKAGRQPIDKLLLEPPDYLGHRQGVRPAAGRAQVRPGEGQQDPGPVQDLAEQDGRRSVRAPAAGAGRAHAAALSFEPLGRRPVPQRSS